MSLRTFFILLCVSSALCGTYIKRPLLPLVEQGTPLKEDQGSPGYNAPARFKIEQGWDLFLTGSFLYWYIEQEGMELAIPMQGQVGTPPVFSSTSGSAVVRSDFNYFPGFKAGIGIGCDGDDWIGALEYTWMHHQINTTAITEGLTGMMPMIGELFALTSWFTQTVTFPFLPALRVHSKWTFDLDMGDAYLARPFYQGRFLTVTPFAGIRGVWLHQGLHVDAMIPEIPTFTVAAELASRNLSHCWGVGPRLGLKGRWLLGAGFRLEGDAAGALLFTRYTKVSHAETAYGVVADPHFVFHNYNTVRPMADLGLGIGWGSYLGFFRNPRAYWDLAVNYDLFVFWGQNMMEKLVDDYVSLSSYSPGDLHMHGITATMGFTF
jgi:hypothetical protein